MTSSARASENNSARIDLMSAEDPIVLTPEQTSRVHRAVLVALTRGMGGKLVVRVPGRMSMARIVTTVTRTGSGMLDVELVLLEANTDDQR